MDLTKDYPRSPREQLDGISILPRAIDKARAHLEGRLGEYIYFGCRINRMLFNAFGVTEEEFLDAVRTAQSDDAMLEWVREYVRPERAKIEEMNRRLLRHAPSSEEEWKKFRAQLDEVDPGNESIKTYVELIDLEEGRLSKESATAT